MNKVVPFVQLQRQYERHKTEITEAFLRVATSGHTQGPEGSAETDLQSFRNQTPVVMGNGTDALFCDESIWHWGVGDGYHKGNYLPLQVQHRVRCNSRAC